jgi:hypothetical protein
VLHHCATTSIQHCLFVVGDLGFIVYCVLVEVTQQQIQIYRNLIHRVSREHLSFFQTIDTIHDPVPLEDDQEENRIDSSTVQTWGKLAQAFSNTRGMATQNHHNFVRMAPVQAVVPYVVSAWNNCKGGQDVCSRILKNCKVDFRKLSPQGSIWIRFILTALMNAHMVFRLLQFEQNIQSFNSYAKLKRFLNKHSSFWEFLKQIPAGTSCMIGSVSQSNTHCRQEWVPSGTFLDAQKMHQMWMIQELKTPETLLCLRKATGEPRQSVERQKWQRYND